MSTSCSALTTLDNDDYTLLTTGTIDSWSGTATPTTVDGKAIDDNAKVVLYTKNGTVADSKLITGKQSRLLNLVVPEACSLRTLRRLVR